MSDQRVLCPITNPDIPLVDANAFRILPEVGDAFYLDLVQVDPTRRTAKVVSRILLPRIVLKAVRDRLQQDVIEYSSDVN